MLLDWHLENPCIIIEDGKDSGFWKFSPHEFLECLYLNWVAIESIESQIFIYFIGLMASIPLQAQDGVKFGIR